jgi:hypothetical protein
LPSNFLTADMPTSNFSDFDVNVDNDDGTVTPVPFATLKIFDVTNDVPLVGTVATDASGHVAGDTLPVAAGTLVRFRLEHDGKGRAAYNEVTTF